MAQKQTKIRNSAYAFMRYPFFKNLKMYFYILMVIKYSAFCPFCFSQLGFIITEGKILDIFVHIKILLEGK